ncbi:MAG: peptidase S8 [Opitutus sp.]|nr:peptidase S8 [Opitutus sp.]
MRPSAKIISLGLALGLACALALLWLWRGSSVEFTTTAPVPGARLRTDATAIPEALVTRAADAPNALVDASLEALQLAIDRGDARAREAVLTFKDDAALRRFLVRAQNAGLTIIAQEDRLRAVRVRFDAVSGLQNELRQNAADYAEVAANAFITLPTAPSKQDRAAVDQVPFGNDTLAFLGATGDRSAWGRGTTIAILDTGVALDATFGTSRIRTLDVGLGLAPGGGREDGHGTAVAALAAGSAKDAPGVAPGAEILSIRVTDATGTSDIFTISKAIVAAVDAGAKVINVSLGGYSTSGVLDAAIGYAIRQGAVIVAAAGNDQAAQLAWPAADPRVVSVGAVDKAEQQVFFSNSGAQLHLTAPGYGVQTAWLDGGRVYVDGTSASAPLVAGAIAAVLSQNPNLNPQQAADLLGRTANDTGRPGADPAFGRGIMNLGTAMNSGNAGYIDTAVSSHFYDAANGQMEFVVQNRSGRAVTGLTLNISADGTTTTTPLPGLAAGETYVAKVPVSESALQAAGSLRFTTQLANPFGVVDQVPANNTRSSVLMAPVKK